MRRGWMVFCCLAALGVTPAFAADGTGDSGTGPSLEYRPPKPILPEPKGPTPAPPVTIFRESYGNFGIGSGSFDKPVDVAMGSQGSMYVLDAGNSRVQMFSDKNDFILEWGAYGTDERRGQFKNPSGLVVVPGSCDLIEADIVLVVDTGNNRIQWFKVPCAGDLKKLPNFPVGHGNSVFRDYRSDYGDLGEYGIGDGRFNRPVDITFDDEWSNDKDKLGMWILDAGNERIQRFVLEADRKNRVFTITGGGGDVISNLSGSRGNLRGLVSLAWSSEGPFAYLYLLGTGCSLQKFKLSNLAVLDVTWPAVAPESGLCVPARVRYDRKTEYVYVLDSGNGLLSVFHRSGNFISAMRGGDRTFDVPGGFALRPESGEFAVADTGNDLVQKFTLR